MRLKLSYDYGKVSSITGNILPYVYFNFIDLSGK